jgi:hypothetical protein
LPIEEESGLSDNPYKYESLESTTTKQSQVSSSHMEPSTTTDYSPAKVQLYTTSTALRGIAPGVPPKALRPCAWTAGKEPALQVTAHTHWPADKVPVPEVRPLAEPVEPVLPEVTLLLEEAVPAVVPVEPVEVVVLPVMALPVPVPFWAMAIAWNMAWVLLAVGLMEKVMPSPQWLACLQ